MKKLLAILLCVFVLTGCTPKTTTTEPEKPATTAPETSDPAKTPAADDVILKIGAYGCISGSDSESGREDVNGVTAAVNWINDHGGIQWGDGRAYFEVVQIDGTSDTAQAGMAMERAITNNELVGIVGGSSSSFTVAVMPIVEKYGVPYFAGTAGNWDVSQQGYQCLFQLFAKGFRYSELQVEFLQKLSDYLQMPVDQLNVGILYMNNAWGTDTSAESADLCDKAGIQVSVNESYPATGLTDATSLITKLMNANCNVVFPASQAEDTKLILQTMKSMNYNPIVIGTGSGFVFNTFYKDMGEDANGVFSTASWNWNSANVQENKFFFDEFLPWFESQYNEFAPEQSGPCAINTFILAETIEALQSTDSQKIRDHIRSLTAENCEWLKMIAGEPAYIDETGSNPNAIACVIQWQEGRPRTVYPEAIAANPILDSGSLQPYPAQFDKFK